MAKARPLEPVHLVHAVPVRKDMSSAMLAPVKPETLAESGGYELRWWAAIRSDGTLHPLPAEIQELTGMQWALEGESVIALALYVSQTRITTILFPHLAECATLIHDRAKAWLPQLIQMAQAGPLPDQHGELVPW